MDINVRELKSKLAAGEQFVFIDVRELKTAVSTGQVDAQENPLTNFIHFELWRHHPYLSLTKHFFGVALLVCNRQWFEELEEIDQDAVQSAALSATQLQRTLAENEDSKALLFLKEQGVSVLNADELDARAMRHACATVSDGIAVNLPAGLVNTYLKS